MFGEKEGKTWLFLTVELGRNPAQKYYHSNSTPQSLALLNDSTCDLSHTKYRTDPEGCSFPETLLDDNNVWCKRREKV
jgi:hypothetical protein